MATRDKRRVELKLNKYLLDTNNIRKHSKLKLPDSLIAATANVENAILVTSDKRLLNSNIVKTVELDQIV